MSARRNVILAALAVVMLAVGVGAYLYGSPRDSGPKKAWQPPVNTSANDGPPSDITYATVPVTASAKVLTLQVADTSEKQQLGLGQRKTIGGDGMIFPYTKPQRLCFWMKDMNFSIDMLWLDANQQVLKIQPDVSPSSYPRTTYCQDGAKYVVELSSGAAQSAGIKTADKLNFSL